MHAMVPHNPYLPKTAMNPYLVGGLGGAGLGLGSGLLWYYLTDQAKRNALTQILLPTLGGAGLGLGAAGLYDYFTLSPHEVSMQNPKIMSPETSDSDLAAAAREVEAAGGDPAGVYRQLPGQPSGYDNALPYQEAERGLDTSTGKQYGAKGPKNPFAESHVAEAINNGAYDRRIQDILNWAYSNAPDLIDRGLEAELMNGIGGPIVNEALRRMTVVR